MFMVYDYKFARKMLDDPRHVKWHPGYDFFDGVCGGTNMFSSEGFRAKHARKATNPAFAPQNVELMMDVVEGILNEWLKDQQDGDKASFVVDATSEMQRLTISVIGQIGFDYKVSKEEREMILQALRRTYEEFAVNVRRNPLRKHLGFLYPEVAEAKKASKDLLALCRKMLEAKRNTSVEGGTISPDKLKTILDYLMENNDYDSEDERVRDMAVYLAGGYETTGAQISWTLYELAKNPSIQTSLRNELRKIQDPRERRYSPALKNVIRESMRLHITAAVTAIRVLAADVPLLDGSGVIPAKSVVAVASYPMHRDASVYENPDKFLPQRWESATTEMKQSWLGFGTGRRNCQGQSLANAELSVVLAKLCSEYSWTLEEEGFSEYYVTLKRVGTLLRATKVQ